MNNSLFSSKTGEWETPPDLYQRLDQEFHFTLDPCSTEENHKCSRYFTKREDGLKQSWSGERVFMNPPYGSVIKHWIQKAYTEGKNGSLVVCLIPSRTDTQWWHEYVMKGEIRFLRGRLKFVGAPYPAPFPSAIVIFGGGTDGF